MLLLQHLARLRALTICEARWLLVSKSCSSCACPTKYDVHMHVARCTRHLVSFQTSSKDNNKDQTCHGTSLRKYSWLGSVSNKASAFISKSRSQSPSSNQSESLKQHASQCYQGMYNNSSRSCSFQVAPTALKYSTGKVFMCVLPAMPELVVSVAII